MLGVGGMGVVVSARHTTLDQVVAIKFTVPDPAESQARDSIVDEWTKLRARKRAARAAVVALAVVTMVIAAAVLLLRVGAGLGPAVEPASGGVAPPTALEVVPLGTTTAQGMTSEAGAGPSMYPTTTSVQSARGAAPQDPSAARP